MNGGWPTLFIHLNSRGCPVLVALSATEPALSEAEGAGILTSYLHHDSNRLYLPSDETTVAPLGPGGAPEPALSLSKGLALFETWDSTAVSILGFCLK
jgi:hypothetical protein